MRRRRRSRTNRNGGDAHGGDDATIGRARHLTRRGHAALQAIMRPGLIMHAFPKHLSFWLLETVLKSDPRPFKKKKSDPRRASPGEPPNERTNKQTNHTPLCSFFLKKSSTFIRENHVRHYRLVTSSTFFKTYVSCDWQRGWFVSKISEAWITCMLDFFFLK
jgi:hypothetical protein